MGLNLKDEKGGGTFDPIPTGRYNVRVSNAEMVKTQEKKDMINLTYQVIEGEQEKRKFFDRAVITPNSLWKLKTLLTVVDSPLAESGDADLEDITNELKDKNLSVYVEVSKNEDGNTRYQCAGWQKYEGKTFTPTVGSAAPKKTVNVLE